jgi:hypothetical protein
MQYENRTTSTLSLLGLNRIVADRLLEAANTLSKKDANQFHIRAFRST